MTAEQAIKREILLDMRDEYSDLKDVPLNTAEQIDEAYDDEAYDTIQDYESEFRHSYDCETDIPAPGSRHYESKSVAKMLSDGTWVGFTYWFGGGKHGEPGAVPWMEDAYFLDVAEEEKMVTVRTFKVREQGV